MKVTFDTKAALPHIDLLWEANAFPVLPERRLPPTGVCVWDRDALVAAVFLYITNSSFGFVAWPVTNPAAPSAVRHRALQTLLARVKDLAREHGLDILFTTTPLPNLKERFVKAGFCLADENVSQFMIDLRKE